jgi:signal-transduction protein with cAMP-binding, CBS, and nucleotidyltransferase domain
MGLRLRKQLEAPALASGRVPLSELGALERTRLKDAFRAIEGLQQTARHHYQTRF